MFKLYQNENQQIIINQDDGSIYMTARSYSELVSADRVTILSRITKNSAIFIADVETGNGIKSYRLIPESIWCDWLKMDLPTFYESLVLSESTIRSHFHNLFNYESVGESPYV